MIRWKFRSATPPLVAQALADQWGRHVESAITKQEAPAHGR